MNADGSGEKALTCGRQPDISGDGTKIVFIQIHASGGQIYTVDANGANEKRITNNSNPDFEPTISRLAKKIAFVSNRHGRAEIFEMTADGAGVRQLTNGSDDPASQPSFSPDGRKIVFTRNVGSRPGGPEVSRHEIYVMNADGTNVVQLTRSGDDQRPTFSPDGKTILFSSRQVGRWTINTISAETGGDRTTPLSSVFYNQNDPAFSPDGSKIVFARLSSISARLFSMNRDGSDIVQLTQPPGGSFDVLPSWVSETVK